MRNLSTAPGRTASGTIRSRNKQGSQQLLATGNKTDKEERNKKRKGELAQLDGGKSASVTPDGSKPGKQSASQNKASIASAQIKRKAKAAGNLLGFLADEAGREA